MKLNHILLACAVAVFCTSFGASRASAQTRVYSQQGYSMRLCFDNRGSFGQVCYPGGTSGDSVGLAYPIGQPYEHIFGAGLWIGGKLDTARVGTSPQVTRVTVGYEGWSGPYFEFWPGSSPADTIWEAIGRGVPRPSSWDAYWGNLIPARSFSDNDRYCMYNDTGVTVAGHVPLRLKVAQSSYVWIDPYAEAVHIIRYRILNVGFKQIDSVYVGMFLDADVGPVGWYRYALHNYSGYYPDVQTAFIHNPVDSGSTPVGITLLDASTPTDSLRSSFRWWQGLMNPPYDADKYMRLASGLIDSNQSPAELSDVQCLISYGPFTLRPSGDHPDTLTLVFGIVVGENLISMRERAARARSIYLSGGQVSVDGPSQEIPLRCELFQNYPNPFNPSTTIKYDLPVDTRVTLKVFNIIGQEVATLVNEEQRAGFRSVEWNAGNLASGVYFYRLEAGRVTSVKKLLVLR